MNTPIAFLFYLLGLIQLCEVYEIEKLGKVDTMITITNTVLSRYIVDLET